MYKVKLTKEVWNGITPESSSTFAALTNETELPFVPFPGLSLALPGPRSWEVESVTWCVTDQIFHCKIKDHFVNPLSINEDFDSQLEFLVEIGWKLIGRFQNDF